GSTPFVAVAGSEQQPDLFNHLRHELGRPGLVSGRRHADGAHRTLEGRHLAFCQLPEVHPALLRHAQDVVVHVGDVLHVHHVGAQVTEVPDQHVEMDVGEGVAEVGGVVGRDPAHVDTHVGPDLDLLELARHLVVEPHGWRGYAVIRLGQDGDVRPETREVEVAVGEVRLPGDLTLPLSPKGWVVFAH